MTDSKSKLNSNRTRKAESKKADSKQAKKKLDTSAVKKIVGGAKSGGGWDANHNEIMY